MNVLALVVLLPLLLGTPLCAWAGHGNTPARRALTAWVAAGVTAASLALLLGQAGAVFDGRTLLAGADWMPSIGLNARFRLDGLALLFALLIGGIGLLVILYAAYYLKRDDPAGTFFGRLMLFMAAMFGVVLADNLLLLVVFWELTSVSSFLLIGYWGRESDARAGARTALAVTGAGGLALLAGVLVLGQITGTFELSQMLDRGGVVRADPRYPLALVLILAGCFAKSAQLPFHFWLPAAMAAPTPASAYLHSATMVKAGIFLIARLYPVIGGSGLFEGIVSSVGLATMVFGAWVAIFRHDLKGLLAYSTISHLGLIVFLLGLATPLSAVAAVFHVLNHATFKASLFMTAGIIDHETGTRDIRRLGGLYRFMPWTATLAAVAAAAMAGVPLVNGFLSKEMFFAEALDGPWHFDWGVAVPIAATLGGVFSVAYSLRFIHDVFFNGPPADMPVAHPHEPPLFMKAPVILLVVVCVVVGVAPALTLGPLVRVAATAVLGTAPPPYELAVVHGLNLPLLMSAIALVGGALLYFGLLRLYRLESHAPLRWTAQSVVDRAGAALLGGIGRVLPRLEGGSLQRSAALLIGAAVGAGAAPFLSAGTALPTTGTRTLLPAAPLAVAIWLALLACGAALVLTHRDRFRGVVLTGVVGLVTALTFATLSAPDLALTQFAVEVVSTVLLLMGLALLPQTSPRESGRLRRGRDALLALAGGAGIGWLCWLAMTRDAASIAWYFVEHALPGGGGTNIVNVILVDFRGYDTFGEITVLAIAAVGVLALLDGFRVRRPATDPQGRHWSFTREPLMLRITSRFVLALALTLAAFVFWRGHNLPGGGFIAGLITAAALVLQYTAGGQRRAETVLRAAGGRRYTRWIGAGLGLAAATGAAAFAFGAPFLTSAHGHPHVPLLGELPLASAALFDLGVYVTVVGATLLLISALGAAGEDGGDDRDANGDRAPRGTGLRSAGA